MQQASNVIYMARTTYTNMSTFTESDAETVDVEDNGEWHTARIVREVCDIADPSGYVYRGGRYRVRVVGPGKGYPRAKTFTGETAWSDSRRRYEDIMREMERASRGW